MDILIQNLQKKIPIHQRTIVAALTTALREKKIRSGQLSIVFVTSHKMRLLNTRYLRHPYSTDVLTFDFLDGQSKSKGRMDAEIIVAPSVAADNAKIYQTSTEEEIILYLVHGILHLLGFDDHGKVQTARMRREEKKLLHLLFKKRNS